MPSIIVDNPLGPMVQNRSEMLQWWNVLNRAEQCWNLAFDGFVNFLLTIFMNPADVVCEAAFFNFPDVETAGWQPLHASTSLPVSN